jgi:hypothetical protein
MMNGQDVEQELASERSVEIVGTLEGKCHCLGLFPESYDTI